MIRRMEEERIVDAGPRERWKVCTIAARDEEGQRVLLPSIQTMAIFKQLMGATSATKIIPPERTRYIVEVREADKVTERIEAAVLYVRIRGRKLILERTGGPEDLAPKTMPASSPAAPTDPEILANTVSDKPLLPAKQKRSASWDDLPPAVKRVLMDEAQVRGALYARFAAGEAWAAKFVAILFADKLEEGRSLEDQREIFRCHFDRSAKDLIARLVRAPAGEASAEAHRAAVLDLCEEVRLSGGPAAVWADKLCLEAAQLKREQLPAAEKQVGVSSGKYPTAKRALELLRGKGRHIQEGLKVLDELTGMHQYRTVAAASKEERGALGEAIKIITAATHAKHPAFQDGLNADLKKIRVLAADHGLQKTLNTAKSLEKIHKEATERAKDVK